MRSCFQSPPQITRQIGTSNDRVELAWTKNIGIWFQSSIWTSDTIYAYTTSENLVAFDGNTGLLFWEKNLPINEQGVTALLATNQIVFTVTATDVHAYRSLTGDWIWSTRLGDGHVSISAQTEGSLLRVYYGNKIFEISQESGEILNEQSVGDINWIQNGVVIRHTSTGPMSMSGMIATSHATGTTLWANNGPTFYTDFPIVSMNNTIFVRVPDSKICALNINVGEYIWCRPEEYVSNIGINGDENIGYAIRSDFVLVKIDLASGKILAETMFLPKELPQDMQNRGFGYSVSVTKDAVIASFGDSGQAFGLKILP